MRIKETHENARHHQFCLIWSRSDGFLVRIEMNLKKVCIVGISTNQVGIYLQNDCDRKVIC